MHIHIFKCLCTYAFKPCRLCQNSHLDSHSLVQYIVVSKINMCCMTGFERHGSLVFGCGVLTEWNWLTGDQYLSRIKHNRKLLFENFLRSNEQHNFFSATAKPVKLQL